MTGPAASGNEREILRTSRLSIRQLHAVDLDFIASLRSDVRVMKHYPRLYTREECADWLSRQFERYLVDGHGFWMVCDANTSQTLGTTGVVTQIVEGEPLIEVGYMFATQHWGKGLASEAAQACRDWAFSNLSTPAVHSLIRPVNARSQNVARRNGMKPARRAMFHELEHDVWRITRAEWEQRPEQHALPATAPPPG